MEVESRATTDVSSLRGERQRTLAVLTILTGAYGLGTLILPRHSFLVHAWADIGWTVASCAAAIRCFATARVTARKSHMLSWVFFGLGCASWTVGMVLWDREELALRRFTPFPNPADMFFLALWPLFVAGLSVRGAEAQGQTLSLKQLGELAVVSSSMVVLSLLVFSDVIKHRGASGAFLITAVAYAALSLSLFLFAWLQLANRRWSPADRRVIAVIIAALFMLAIVNTLYAYTLLLGTYEAGHELDVLWFAVFALVAFAAFEETWIARGVPLAAPRGLSIVDALVPSIALLSILIAAAFLRPRLDERALGNVFVWCGVLVVGIGVRSVAVLRLELSLRSELRTRERQFVEAQRLEAVATLAGGLAHDLNNLLCCMMAGMDMIRRRVGNASGAANYIDLVELSTTRAAALAKRLSGLAKRDPSEVEAFRPYDVVRHSALLIRSMLPSSVTVAESPGEPDLWITGNAGQLEQALLNLGINGGRAMPGGGRLDLSVSVDTSVEPTQVVFTVRDTGVGIPRENLARIFEPFFTTHTRTGGSGLGLAMVRAVAEAHGGRVSVESEVGRGSSFRIAIPLVSAASRTDVLLERVGEPPTGHETLLLVDASPGALLAARLVLEEAGYRVLAVASTNEALRAIDGDQDISLVMLDADQPEASRIEIARAAKSARQPISVVLVANEPSPFGADALVSKPFGSVTIGNVVRRVLDERAARTRSTPPPPS